MIELEMEFDLKLARRGDSYTICGLTMSTYYSPSRQSVKAPLIKYAKTCLHRPGATYPVAATRHGCDRAGLMPVFATVSYIITGADS